MGLYFGFFGRILDNFTKQRHNFAELFDFFHSEINSLGDEKINLKHAYILGSSVENQVVFERKKIYEGSVLLAHDAPKWKITRGAIILVLQLYV